MGLPRRSLAADLPRLLDDLGSTDAPRRDAAIARLSVIGERAVPRLVAVAQDEAAPTSARAAALQALEAVDDARGHAAAVPLAAARDGAVALSAIAVLGRAVAGTGRWAARALDCLTGVVLDSHSPVDRRLAALEALESLPARQLRPIQEALARDPASRIVARVTRQQAGVMAPLDELVAEGLPDDPGLVAAVVREDAGATRVTVLRRAIDAVRHRERQSGQAERAAWMGVRGALHLELASRPSRLALYDLRETLETAGAPLPAGFLAATSAIGDTSCLEPIARAWMAGAGADRWWRDHLEDAFRAVVRREGLTRRHPALVRILNRWPSAGALVATAPKARRLRG
jgi:hypothetical protein